MLDAGYWILDTRFSSLAARYSMSFRPGTGSRFGIGIFAVAGKILMFDVEC